VSDTSTQPPASDPADVQKDLQQLAFESKGLFPMLHNAGINFAYRPNPGEAAFRAEAERWQEKVTNVRRKAHQLAPALCRLRLGDTVESKLGFFTSANEAPLSEFEYLNYWLEEHVKHRIWERFTIPDSLELGHAPSRRSRGRSIGCAP
jgi:hypothetical protein